jgi:hypothetical protein
VQDAGVGADRDAPDERAHGLLAAFDVRVLQEAREVVERGRAVPDDRVGVNRGTVDRVQLVQPFLEPA